MSPAELHADSIVIDGLIIAKWNRDLFEDMRKGGLTAANCTVSVWEGFQATINNIVASQTLIRENSDLVIPVKTTADIRRAKALGKTGIIFGFQNAHAFEDQLGYIEIFKQFAVPFGNDQPVDNDAVCVQLGWAHQASPYWRLLRRIVCRRFGASIGPGLKAAGCKSDSAIAESVNPRQSAQPR